MAAPSISNRVFGSEIPDAVKDKLEARQVAAKSPLPLEQVSNIATDFEGVADLSSRTPFARLWMAVELVKFGEEKKSGDYNSQPAVGPSQNEMPPRENWEKDIEYFWHGEGVVENNASSQKEVWYHKVHHLGQKIYQIGSHEQDAVSTPGQSMQSSGESPALQAIAPDEQSTNKNEFLKPPAGITSVSSNTEGSLGAIKKSTVNFTIYNFHDFENIYSRYLLRHGAQVFLDFGWSTLSRPLYNPESLLGTSNLDDLEDKLYGPHGEVDKNKGDLEILIGFVTSYNANVKDDGSIECTLTITSKNAALIERNTDAKLKSRLKLGLDIEILRFAASGFREVGGEGVGRLLIQSEEWSKSAESVREWEDVFFAFAEENLSSIGSSDNMPGYNAMKTGVFFQKMENAKALFVSWGFFEDKILNTEFGFGSNKQDTTGAQKPEASSKNPKFNSQDSFIRYDENLRLAQLYEKDITKKKFIYPDNWNGPTYNLDRLKVKGTEVIRSGIPKSTGDQPPPDVTQEENRIKEIDKKIDDLFKKRTHEFNRIYRSQAYQARTGWDPLGVNSEYAGGEDSGQAASREKIAGYDQQLSKLANEREMQERAKREKKLAGGNLDYTGFDKGLHQMPMRELFVSVDLIKSALDSSQDVTQFIKAVAKGVSDASDGIFDLQFAANNNTHAELSVIDRNLLYSDNNNDEFMDKLFTFSPGSPSSIVKTFNLNFSTPKNGLQNMIAIQSLGSTGGVVALEDTIDQAIATQLTENGIDLKDYNIFYLPKIGTYRGEQISARSSGEAVASVNYHKEDEIFGSSRAMTNAGGPMFLEHPPKWKELQEIATTEKKSETSDNTDPATTKQEDQKREAELLELRGYQVAKSLPTFYQLLAKQQVFTSRISTVIPVSLSLGIYGIAALAPGDIFKVDYLPKKYRDQVFFQITKVSHNINTAAWTTKLDTVMRLHPIKKSGRKEYSPALPVVLESSVLNELELLNWNPKKGAGMKGKLDMIVPAPHNPVKNYNFITQVFLFVARETQVVKVPRSKLIVDPVNGRQKMVTYLTGAINSKSGEGYPKINKDASYILIIQGRFWTVAPIDAKLEDYDRSIVPDEFFIKNRRPIPKNRFSTAYLNIINDKSLK